MMRTAPRPPLAFSLLAAVAVAAACGNDASVRAAASTAAAAGPAAAGRPAALGRVERLPTPAAARSAEPSLAVARDGALYLSWLEPAAGGAHALRFARWEGERWSAPRTIAERRDFFVNWADFPSLAVLPDGRLAAHWLQKRGAGSYAYDVQIVTSADGGATWSAPARPHRDTTQAEHGFVSLFPAGGDSLGVVWLDGRHYGAQGHGHEGAPSGATMVLHTTLAPDGSLGAERTLDARACDCCQTAVALAAAGPVLVYRDRSAGEIRDVYTTRRLGGQWSTPLPVHRDGWQIDGCPVNGPAIAARGGRVVVAWFTAAQDTPRVRLAFSPDGGATFGPPLRVDAGSPEGRVDVELLEDGAALVTWLERTRGEDGAEIRARRATRDGRLGPPLTLAATGAARSSGFPRIAIVGNDFFAAWTATGDSPGVRVARAPLEP